MSCALGQVTFDDFIKQYGCFYLEYALDGHESDANEQQLLKRYTGRIALHREILDSIIYRLTSEELLAHPEAAKAGFIGRRQGLDILKMLAQTYLNVTPSD